MQTSSTRNPANPLSELISDETYRLLAEHKLLNEKSLRDYQIRRKFRELRSRNVPTTRAIHQLREDHPYLQFDTVRKIVYGLNRR